MALMLAFTSFACTGEQASNAQDEKGGAGKVVAKPVGQAGTPAGATSSAEHYRLNCRMQTHIVKENMSEAEARDFTARVTYRVVANLDGSGNKDMGEILDDIDVPAYKGICG
ncbi:MAG: hypothetical protein M3317_08470 [Actinomycetota bacterium]|nr:hypothetical protein [Actinomycetota bacterium]